jgi:hypothetical protein
MRTLISRELALPNSTSATLITFSTVLRKSLTTPLGFQFIKAALKAATYSSSITLSGAGFPSNSLAIVLNVSSKLGSTLYVNLFKYHAIPWNTLLFSTTALYSLVFVKETTAIFSELKNGMSATANVKTESTSRRFRSPLRIESPGSTRWETRVPRPSLIVEISESLAHIATYISVLHKRLFLIHGRLNSSNPNMMSACV